MANNQINKLLEFANMQMAAEAFLVQGVEIAPLPGQVLGRLVRGNTHASAFTPVQAEQFTTQYEVVTQYRNDPLDEVDGIAKSGFSGTLFKDRKTGELTLSFRSTEFIDDAVRDTLTGQLEIKNLGWAFGQIAAMEDWYKNTLLAPGGPLAGKNFNVTGYSLGGHLATAFNILRKEDGTDGSIKATYTFNGAGTGQLLNGTLTSLIAQFNQIRTGYLGSTQWNALSVAERNSILSQAQARVAVINGEYARVGALAGVKNSNFNNQTSPLGDQASLGYQVAALLVARNTVGASANLQGGGPLGVSSSRVQGPFTIENLTEVVGMETDGTATSFVSNSGLQYGKTRIEVPIEAQPYYRGNVVLSALTASISNGSVKLLVDNPGSNDFGDTHSMVLLVDSLSLMAAMEKLSPALTIADAKAIFAAVSNAAMDYKSGTQGNAEGDTLEKMLDAMRKLTQGPNLDPTLSEDQMRQVLQGYTWADVTLRAKFQDNLKKLREKINGLAGTNSNSPFTLTNLATSSAVGGAVDSLAAGVSASAKEQDGIAYRYALQELNPFVVLGEAAVGALYGWHNLSGELELYKPAERTGALTTSYLEDRAKLLERAENQRGRARFNSASQRGWCPLQPSTRLLCSSERMKIVLVGFMWVPHGRQGREDSSAVLNARPVLRLTIRWAGDTAPIGQARRSERAAVPTQSSPCQHRCRDRCAFRPTCQPPRIDGGYAKTVFENPISPRFICQLRQLAS